MLLIDSMARYLTAVNSAFSLRSTHVRHRARPHDDMLRRQDAVDDGHTHDHGHAQGQEVTDVEGHAVGVEVAAGHVGDVVIVSRGIEAEVVVAAAVSHQDAAAVTQNTATVTSALMHSQEVAANQ